MSVKLILPAESNSISPLNFYFVYKMFVYIISKNWLKSTVYLYANEASIEFLSYESLYKSFIFLTWIYPFCGPNESKTLLISTISYSEIPLL